MMPNLTSRMNVIDLNVRDVYIRDEFDPSVLKEGIRRPSNQMVMDTLISGGSNGGRSARMFLKSEDMYRMLFSRERHRIKRRENYLIFVVGCVFQNAITEVGDTLKELGYSTNIPFPEYFNIEDLYPSNFVVVKTRKFLLSYSQCRPCIGKINGERVYINHLKDTILVPGISDKQEFITPRIIHEVFFPDQPDFMRTLAEIYHNILCIDEYNNECQLLLGSLISYFQQSIIVEYNSLLKTISKDIYNISKKSDREKFINIAIKTRGKKYQENIKVLQEYLDKINIFEDILCKPKTLNLFADYSVMIREKDITRYRIDAGTSYSYNITHPKLL